MSGYNTHNKSVLLAVARADPILPNIGLTRWKAKHVRKGDNRVSRNFLSEPEVRELNRLTTLFPDFAEDRADRRQQITMDEWVTQTDRFLAFNQREVLKKKPTKLEVEMDGYLQELVNGS